jgi:hypothetical protein
VTRRKKPVINIKPVGTPQQMTGSGPVQTIADFEEAATETWRMRGTAGSAPPGKDQLVRTVANVLLDIPGPRLPHDTNLIRYFRSQLKLSVSTATLSNAKKMADLQRAIRKR